MTAIKERNPTRVLEAECCPGVCFEDDIEVLLSDRECCDPCFFTCCVSVQCCC